MATIHVRDIPDDVYEALRERAGRSGRSLSSELRRIVTDAVRLRPALDDVIREVEEIRRSFTLDPGAGDALDRALAEDRRR
jgi:plasmid stability protein